MPDPAMLVKVEDSAGRWMLGKSTGSGREMLAVNGCEGPCCGGCTTIRRYNSCPPTPGTEPCNADPSHVWLCDNYRCPGGNQADYVRWAFICYAGTNTRIPIEDLPPGDRLLIPPFLDAVECIPGCSTEGCHNECPVWIIGTPCPGQPEPNPPVYLHPTDMANLPQCWVQREYFEPPIGNRCYTFNKGIVSRTQPPGTGVVYRGGQFPNVQTLCCQCVDGCSYVTGTQRSCHTPNAQTTQFKCCCSANFCANISLSFYWEARRDATPFTPAGLSTLTRTGSGTVCVQDGVVTTTGNFAYVYTVDGMVVQSGQEPPPSSNACIDESGPGSFFGGGGSFPVFANFLADYLCPADVGGQTNLVVTQPDGSYTDDRITVAENIYTCGYKKVRWTGTSDRVGPPNRPDFARIRHMATGTYTFQRTSQGICSGGCGTVAAPSPIGQGQIVQPAPPDQWPLWAKALAKFRQHGDKGIGSTIERNLGFVGEAYKEAVKRLTGETCGCASRAGRLNQQFPYT